MRAYTACNRLLRLGQRARTRIPPDNVHIPKRRTCKREKRSKKNVFIFLKHILWVFDFSHYFCISSAHTNCRRKFRSQTSDNMDRWKSRGGKSQRGEEKKWEDQRRERVRRKKMQVREKVGKSRFTVFFPDLWLWTPLDVRKVGSLKWRVRNHLARWEMKNCTWLWREAHSIFFKTTNARTTFGTPLTHGIWKIFMRGPLREDLTRIAARSSAKSCARSCKDLLERISAWIPTRSCDKGLCKTMQDLCTYLGI